MGEPVVTLSFLSAIVVFFMLLFYKVGLVIRASYDSERKARAVLQVSLMFGLIKIKAKLELQTVDDELCVVMQTLFLQVLIPVKSLIISSGGKKRDKPPIRNNNFFQNALLLTEVVQSVALRIAVGTKNAYHTAMVCQFLQMALEQASQICDFKTWYCVEPSFDKRLFRINLEGILELRVAELTNEAVKLLLLSKGEKNVYANASN